MIYEVKRYADGCAIGVIFLTIAQFLEYGKLRGDKGYVRLDELPKEKLCLDASRVAVDPATSVRLE